MRRLRSRLAEARGTALVEAALITPLLLFLTLSIVDFGAMFYCYLALENGVSQASRFAVTGNVLNDPNNPGNPLSRTDSIKAAMRQATPTLTIPDAAFSFNHMAQGGNVWHGTGWMNSGFLGIPQLGLPMEFEATFDTPGEYIYYCALHGDSQGNGMAAKLTVAPA